MGFTAFAGRIFFSSVFVYSAWKKISNFGADGGPELELFLPKFKKFESLLLDDFGFQLPHIPVNYVFMSMIGLEVFGSILFSFGSKIGAYLLMILFTLFTPILHDFYNYNSSSKEFAYEFNEFLKDLALFGGLLFYLGMRNSIIYKRKKSLKSKVH